MQYDKRLAVISIAGLSFLFMGQAYVFRGRVTSVSESATSGSNQPVQFNLYQTPSSQTSQVISGVTSNVYFDGTANQVEPGHQIAGLFNTFQRTTRTLNKMFVVEARFDQTAAGTVTHVPLFTCVFGPNSGTITEGSCLYNTDHSSITRPATYYFLRNDDAVAKISNAGPMTQGGLATFITATSAVVEQMRLSYKGSVNAGSKLAWSADDATETANVQHVLASGTATTWKVQTLTDSVVSDKINVGTTGTVALRNGAAVASASAIVPSGNVFHVTGTTGITSITGTAIPSGACIKIIFDDILTMTDGSNLKMAGNFTTSADDTISLCWDGSNWYETGRSVN